MTDRKENWKMEVLVDARGKACPLPVIETRNALREHGAPVGDPGG